MAWRIVQHAFSMIFGNIGQALRVSVGPGLILIVVMGILAIAAPAMLFLGSFLIVLIFAWIAVSWHRFILLEEYTGLLPAVNDRNIGGYVGQSFLLGFLLILILIPILLIGGGLVSVLYDGDLEHLMQGTSITAVVLYIIAFVFLGYIMMRWSIKLPAVSVGKPITLKEAWAATKPMSMTILGVNVIILLINFVPAFIFGFVFAALPIVGTVIDIAFQWLTLMLGVSVLTTLYGHLIEGRDLT